MASTQKIIPLEVAPSLTYYHTFDANIASYLYIANAVNLYSGGPRFQSRPGHRLSWSSSWLLNFQFKNRERTSIRTRPFPCIYCQAIVQRSILRDTDSTAGNLRARISICCWGKLTGSYVTRIAAGANTVPEGLASWEAEKRRNNIKMHLVMIHCEVMKCF